MKAHSPTIQQNSSTLFASLCNGITISLIETPWWIAMLTLIFSGPLSDRIGDAAIYLIAGAVISMTMVSFFSSWKGVIWLPQDIPTALLVIITTGIISGMPADTSTDTLFVTVVVTIALTSILTGLGMYLTGALQLGEKVRFLPFTMMAGFLGGTGCLLLLGGMNSALPETMKGSILNQQALLHWLPGVMLAALIYGLGRYIKSALLIPLLMLVATLAFFTLSLLSGISVTELRAEGWLFNTAPHTGGITWLTTGQISQVQWSVIFAQADTMIILVVAAVIAMLLNNSGFELSVNGCFDHNKDLRNTGLANMIAGMVGGWPGYMSPAWSAINARQGHQLPLTGLFVALISAILLWHSTQLMAYIPRFVIGSAIAYVGISFIFDWIIIPFKRLSGKDFTCLLTVVVVVMQLGS